MNAGFEQLRTEERAAIFQGSKSFSLSSLLFRAGERQGAWSLYNWCRYVDDQIDLAQSAEEANQKVHQVVRQTTLAFQDWTEAEGPYRSLGWAAENYHFDETHALELIQGLRLDSIGPNLGTEADLLHYCYCVAGTVGLMMCSVMGVTDPASRQHAIALGQAMQLTNIARDLQEDWDRGRCYIPNSWLLEAGLSRQDFGEFPYLRLPLQKKLLTLAETHYRFGLMGLPYLPWRARLAVASAGLIYRAIGRKIQTEPLRYLRSRAYVPLFEKIYWFCKALSLAWLAGKTQPGVTGGGTLK